jgi:hypothetical protein
MNRQDEHSSFRMTKDVVAATRALHYEAESLERADNLTGLDVPELAPAVAEGELLDGGLEVSAEAAGADFEADGDAADVDGLVLDVGFERAVSTWGFALPASRVFVSDVAPVAGALGADVAFCHLFRLYSLELVALESAASMVSKLGIRGQTAASLRTALIIVLRYV